MHDRHDAAPEHDFLLLVNKGADMQSKRSVIDAWQLKA
jgi:hypothetical protein